MIAGLNSETSEHKAEVQPFHRAFRLLNILHSVLEANEVISQYRLRYEIQSLDLKLVKK
jgi:hypothetical protein